MNQNAHTESAPSVMETVEPEAIDLNAYANYFNRELSHMKFNYRVLKQALDTRHPLLNRLLFCCIFSSNMDEFFEIRVAGLRQQIKYGRETIGPDGMPPAEVLKEIDVLAHRYVSEQYQILNEVLIPELDAERIRFLRRTDWTEAQSAWISDYFMQEIMPVINPIGLDPSHPFPRLVNKSLNFIVSLEGRDAFGRETGMAIVPAPRSLPRLVRLPDEVCEGGDNLVFLSSIIHAEADQLFPGMQINGCYQFRLTRNADLELEDDDMVDLASTLRGELLSRRFGDAVRLEVADNCPEDLIAFLLREFSLTEAELYRVNGPVNLTRLMAVSDLVQRPDLEYPAFTPNLPKSLKSDANILATIRNRDVLLLHPFESFTPVVDFLRQAAKDPNVLAIQQTLYRTGDKSPIVDALVDAARRGKEVTAVIELRARFDEEENLELASRLQEAGVIVVYGVVGYKTHAKMVLVVRREETGLKRYAHLGTGNYHAGNARLYTDYSLLTSDDVLVEDVQRIFRQLTGMGKQLKVKKLLHAPFTLHDELMRMIQREMDHVKNGKTGYLLVKVNSLTEPKIIRQLYMASQAGVRIDLIIRGICCLRPGVPGLSENIHVRSIVGRFLEHTRVYYFANDGQEEVYCASADWMVRNLLHRVEVCFPVESAKLKARIKSELEDYMRDNCGSWILLENGEYERILPAEGEELYSAQEALLERLAAK